MEEAKEGASYETVGQSILAAIDDCVDEVIRSAYVEAWDCPGEEIPDELIGRERAKLVLMLDGDYGPEYLEILRSIVREHIGAGLDHSDYLRAYGIFAGNLIQAIDAALSNDDPTRGARLRYVLLATHTECGLALEHFFRSAATQEWAEREALAQTFQDEVMGTVSEVGQALDAMVETAESLRVGGEAAVAAGRASETRALDAAKQVADVASATQEISDAALDLSRQVTMAAEKARSAKAGANRAEETVDQLAEQSGRIVEVVRLIRSIAEQTRMLALNASIEAARAGEAGRGFAVVASEVKSLAHDTAQATDRIAQRIDKIQGAATDARAAMNEVTSAIEGIDSSVSAIASTGEEQSGATRRIAQQTESASSGVKSVSNDVAGIVGFAQHSSQVSDGVHQNAEKARSATTRLSTALETFITAIRG